MQLNGYPDLLSFTRRNRTTARIKARLDIVSKEAVTGQRADLTKATNGRVGGAHLMRKALNDIELSTRINSLTTTRLDLISQGISGARIAMNGIDTRAIIALNSAGSAGVVAISNEAEANLRSVMTALSIKHGPRNLLSGNVTDRPPFSGPGALLDDVRNIMTTAGSPADIDAALDIYFNDPAGGFQTNIYTGGTDAAPPMHIGNGQKISVDVRADSQTIKDVLRGLAVIATAQSSGNAIGTSEFTEIFNNGITAATNGTSGLISLEGNLGIFSETLEKANARNQFEALSLSAAYQTLTGRDQFEAAAELKQLEVQLESSYIITARLSGLTLTNYLR